MLNQIPLLNVVLVLVNTYSFLCLGAHSHIRGLGLDDALEPRQVASSLKVTCLVVCCSEKWDLLSVCFVLDIKRDEFGIKP